MSDYTAKQIGKFWSKVAIANADDCWNWIGSNKSQGYGQMQANKVGERSHRIAYKLTYGSIPDNLQVLHKCDNTLCCNPSHLFLGTHLDNMRDKVNKGRQVRGEALHFHKLTTEDITAIRERYAVGNVFQWQLAKEYGVKQQQISKIIRGQRWRHIR